MPRKVNRQEWVECPRCGARPYEHCRNYKGQRKAPCRLDPPPGNNQLGAATGAVPAPPKQQTLFPEKS